jgi:flagellar basal-body rod modification protein FlgD
MSTVTSATSASATTTSSQDPMSKLTADKDLFLKLMVEQLKNQDPQNASDSDKFVQQLSEMTSMERLTNIATSQDAMVKTLQTSQSVGLIGHTVGWEQNGTAHQGVVQSVQLDKGAATLTVDGQAGVDPSVVAEVK